MSQRGLARSAREVEGREREGKHREKDHDFQLEGVWPNRPTSCSLNVKHPRGIYLTYLYAGLTQWQLSMTFGIPQHTVSDYVEAGRKGLARFVEKNLVLRAITRRVMMEHRTSNVERLYGLEESNAVVTIWDATYEYLPKSSNFRFQAATYSGHKSRNLVKAMVAVVTGEI